MRYGSHGLLNCVLLGGWLACPGPVRAEAPFAILFQADAAGRKPALHDVVQVPSTATYVFHGRIVTGNDPWIVLPAVTVRKPGPWLLLDMDLNGIGSISIYYTCPGDAGFSEARVRHFGVPKETQTGAVLALDVNDAPGWAGGLSGLRIDFDHTAAGAEFALRGVRTVERLPRVSDRRTLVRLPRGGRALQWERMAAFHQTIVTVDEAVPAAGICTYHNERFEYAMLAMLCKAVVGVETKNGPVWCDEAGDPRIKEDAGVVRARFILDGATVTLEVMPLVYGRTPPVWEGRALLRVASDPPRRLLVDVGGYGPDKTFWQPRQAWLRSPRVGTDEDNVTVRNDVGVLTNPRSPRVVAVRGAVRAEPVHGRDRNAVRFRFANGRGWTVVAFAADAVRAVKVARIEPDAEMQRVRIHYKELLEGARIETPEPEIDATFRSALITCEYCWLRPWGWVEGIHHWMAMWHMQHSQMADWVGQQDRAEENILWLLGHLRGDGAVQHFSPGGFARRDFGGSNQYIAWQVQRHWRSTGDREFLKKIETPFDRVVRQTWKEYDPDGNGLLRWGQQVANQEDYVSTPHDGASPTIAGIEILRTQAMIARGLGRMEKAARIKARIAEITVRLKKELWMPGLSRFMFYKDPRGVVRPEGQYHTYAWPVIYDLLDPLDAYTSARHLSDRLTGPDGALYMSNNFACHVLCTAGPQAAGQQQPWGLLALGRVGLNDDAIRPIRFIAHAVQAPPHHGVWPEISKEPTPAYFSPPAGVYVFGIVEGLFGLDADVPRGQLLVRPAFPSAWPRARLHLPEFSAEFAREGNRLRYDVRSKRPLRRIVRWHLPVGRVRSVTVNGGPVRFTLDPAVNGSVLHCDTAPVTRSVIEVEFGATPVRIEAPRSLAVGDSFEARVRGGEILRVEDREGVLEDVAIRGDALRARVRPGLLDPWLRYGRLGQMNFSRRTVFLDCRIAGQRYFLPLDLTLLPAVEVAAGPDLHHEDHDWAVDLLVRNNRDIALGRVVRFLLPQIDLQIELDVPARSERRVRVSLPLDRLCFLTPGRNPATLILPDGREVRFTVLVQHLFQKGEALGEYAAKCACPVKLPEEKLSAVKVPADVRGLSAFGHPPWNKIKDVMAGLPETVALAELPGIVFPIVPGKLLVVSGQKGPGAVVVPIDRERVWKLYLLVLSGLDNHDQYTPVVRISARCANRVTLTQTYFSPGDLDWMAAPAIVGLFATARVQRLHRFGLLSLLDTGDADWSEAHPEAFPQPEFWADSVVFTGKQAVFNVLEFEFRRARALRELRIETFGTEAAVGIAAIVLLGENDDAQRELPMHLRPPPALRTPVTVFDFSDGDLHGWHSEPSGVFSVLRHPVLFPQNTLNSLVAKGESAMGRAISPPFVLEGDRLELHMHGGKRLRKGDKSVTYLVLRDAGNGKELLRINPSGSHVLNWNAVDVTRWKGRRVRLELVDENPDSSYAWIGLEQVVLRYVGP